MLDYFCKITSTWRFPLSAILAVWLVLSTALNVYQHHLLRRLSAFALDSCDSCCDVSDLPWNADHPTSFENLAEDEPIADLFLRFEGLNIAKLLRRPSSPDRSDRQPPSSSSENSDGLDDLYEGTARYLSSSHDSSLSNSISNSSLSSSSDSSHSNHEAHQQDAMVYLFNALVIGAGVSQMSAKYPTLQTTVVLFVVGVIFSLVMEGLDAKEHLGVLGNSYNMWMDIDPHLFMFALLPALLAGDAMSIDTSVAKRVAYQCLYLAGPGVLISSMITALFLQVYIGWDFLLSLVAGSILCATDPVAVVALLKELGASPVLTVQIQGESLLNDGTAIVLFLISYNMKSGESYDFFDIVMFLVKKAMMAWALGLFIGYMFFSWIRWASDRLNHNSSSIQIALTLCCAYWSFIMVEGVLGLSGVLATVASSLVLAHHMWPHIVSPDSLHHVWDTFESLGNTIVFFLAGSLTGEAMTHIEFIDVVDLLVIYVFLLLLRGILIFASLPILRRLSDGGNVTVADAILMTWGGLRGAVGLALAIQVRRQRAEDDGVPQISDGDARKLLFFVSGIAFLTTIINAVTAPILVDKLGITAAPQARQQLLKMFHQQLVGFSEDSRFPPAVTESLKEMLEKAAKEIDTQKVQKEGPRALRARAHERDSDNSPREGSPGREVGWVTSFNSSKRGLEDFAFQSNQNIVEVLGQERKLFNQIDEEDLKLVMAHMPAKTLLGKRKEENDILERMAALIKDTWVDEGMAKVVNTCFLNLVMDKYWKLIHMGELRPGSAESDILLTSIRVSMSPYRADLVDYNVIQDFMKAEAEAAEDSTQDQKRYVEDVGAVSMRASENNRFQHYGSTLSKISQSSHSSFVTTAFSASSSSTGPVSDTCVGHLVMSLQFNIAVAVAIFLNSIQVAVEEAARNEENDDNLAWLIMDIIFTVFFSVEFLLKHCHLGCRYFRDAWNRFDFVLVVLGIFGLIMSIASMGSSKAAGQARIIRVARVLRTLRFLRVFRLFHAKLSADKYVSVELARHMKKIQTLTCFCHGHIAAQQDLVKFFGCSGNSHTHESEIARCILQSNVHVYRALGETVREQQMLEKELVMEMYYVTERKNITETLEKFVMEAHRAGAINARETHAILHPLHHQIASCMSLIQERAEGLLDKKTAPAAAIRQTLTKGGTKDSSDPVLWRNRSRTSALAVDPRKSIEDENRDVGGNAWQSQAPPNYSSTSSGGDTALNVPTHIVDAIVEVDSVQEGLEVTMESAGLRSTASNVPTNPVESIEELDSAADVTVIESLSRKASVESAGLRNTASNVPTNAVEPVLEVDSVADATVMESLSRKASMESFGLKIVPMNAVAPVLEVDSVAEATAIESLSRNASMESAGLKKMPLNVPTHVVESIVQVDNGADTTVIENLSRKTSIETLTGVDWLG